MNDNAIKSMTGFGRGEACGAVKVTVELNSVNRKQFDCSITLPRELLSLEIRVQKLVHALVARGYVKGVVTIAATAGGASEALLDIDAVALQVASLRALATKLGLHDDLKASSLLRLPEAVRPRLFGGTPEELWPLLEEATTKAVAQLLQMRASEGAALALDLQERLAALETLAQKITAVVPTVPLAYKETLEKRLTELLANGQAVDPALLAREVAIFADRCDVSEELTRLASHFKQFRQTLATSGTCGRALDFICQELFREINTIASKANNATISSLVIEFKAQLEAVREQVQNVE